MKLCQFQVAGGGRRVGVLDGDDVIDITAPRARVSSVLDLDDLRHVEEQGLRGALLVGERAAGQQQQR